jgi:hypothetical protein
MKLSSSIAAAAVLAAVSCLASPALAQLADGGFETPVAGSGTFIQVNSGGSVGAWTVGGHDVLVINTSYKELGNSIVFNAQSGNQSLDITGHGNTGFNTVSQTFATTPGQAYSLSFYLGNMQDSAGSGLYSLASSVNVGATGNLTQLFTNAAVTLNAVNWALQTYGFTATGASTTLTFTNATVGDNFAGIDGVALAAVPEPASLAVWGAVSALGAAFGWRRRRASLPNAD